MAGYIAPLFQDIEDGPGDLNDGVDHADEAQSYQLTIGDYFELDLKLTDLRPRTVIPRKALILRTSLWRRVGKIIVTSQQSLYNGSDLDWALVEIDDPALYKPNLNPEGYDKSAVERREFTQCKGNRQEYGQSKVLILEVSEAPKQEF
jgi:hypothetical protein